MIKKIDSDPAHSPAVLAPNSVPTGSRFETSTQNYAVGFPDLQEPARLIRQAERMAAERQRNAAQPTGSIVMTEVLEDSPSQQLA